MMFADFPGSRATVRLGRSMMVAGLLALMGGLIPMAWAVDPPVVPQSGQAAAKAKPGLMGPTLHLDYGSGKSSGNPIAEFMYFVALIAPEPVSMTNSAGNTQCVRVLSLKRHFTRKSFLVSCEFEFDGEGSQRNVFDQTEKIRLHERELKAGGSLVQLLDSINVEGGGMATIEAEGTITGEVPTVTEVRLRFNSRGRESPVTIGICDFKYQDGAIVTQNETVARVNTLTFQRQPGQPKMDVTLASVKRKNAGNNPWQNFVGGLKGTAANLFLKPIPVQVVGNDAMLSFGLAIASEAQAYTFPFAKNLRSGPVEPR